MCFDCCFDAMLLFQLAKIKTKIQLSFRINTEFEGLQLQE
jgi:hypothetical protein